MQGLMRVIFSISFVIIYMNGSLSDPITPNTETMARPTRPKAFSSPEDLRSYLDQLGNFYAIAGRPRFGKRNLAPWMANYVRDESDVIRRMPISQRELLQLLSSANQSDD